MALSGLKELLMVPKSQQCVCLWCILPQILHLHPLLLTSLHGEHNVAHEAVYIRAVISPTQLSPIGKILKIAAEARTRLMCA